MCSIEDLSNIIIILCHFRGWMAQYLAPGHCFSNTTPLMEYLDALDAMNTGAADSLQTFPSNLPHMYVWCEVKLS